jgi:hypothetical protein
MIEKFNFYDIYGYFLPGLAFLAILWVPFGLVQEKWPSSDWSSALIAAAIAYFLGHLLQNVVTNAIPSQRAKGKNRFPSDYFLDPEDPELPQEVKTKIAAFILSKFGLDLEVDKDGNQQDKSNKTTIDKVRNNAFLLARQVLIQGKAVSYAEQFQGMYSVTRGLFAVFALASVYWLGWSGAAARNSWTVRIAVVMLALAVLALINISVVSAKISDRHVKRKVEITYALGLLVVFLLLGYLAGAHSHVTILYAALLGFLSACALLACLRFRSAYDFFAARFASTVWRDYLAFNVTSAGSPQPTIEDA